MTSRHRWATALAAAAVLHAGEARGQAPSPVWSDGGIAMDRLEPTPPGDPFFSVPSPFVGGHLVPRAALVLDHVKDPLALPGGRAVIGEQTFVHAGFSLAIVDRVLASIELPVVLFQSGDAPTSHGITYALPASPIAKGGSFRPATGDLRLGVRVRVLGQEDGPFQAALGSYLHVPSFMTSSILREPSVRTSPHLLLGGRHRYLVWSAALGAVLRSSETPSALTYGAGAALSLGRDRLTIGSEIFVITPVRDGILPVSATTSLARPALTSAEWLLGARLRLGPLVFGAALGTGLGHAPGTPSLRALGSVALSPLPPAPATPPPADTDQDGTSDAEDACPYAFGSRSSDRKRSGCPAQDRDGDGVADEGDTCPERAGPKEKGGCGPDRDGDGVPDELDLCPEASGSDATAGCPDQDGDGSPDAEDACPEEKGKWHVDSKLNGCPEAPVAPAPAPAPAPGEKKIP